MKAQAEQADKKSSPEQTKSILKPPSEPMPIIEHQQPSQVDQEIDRMIKAKIDQE